MVNYIKHSKQELLKLENDDGIIISKDDVIIDYKRTSEILLLASNNA